MPEVFPPPLSAKDVKMPEVFPPPLSAKDVNSFAYPSFKDRAPVIIAKSVDSLTRQRAEFLQAYPDKEEIASEELKNIIGSLSQLRYEVTTNKPAVPIRDSDLDAPSWNQELEIEKQKNGGDDLKWFESGWLWMECYLYRRIQEAVSLCTIMNTIDVFEKQKQEAFTKSFEAVSVLTTHLSEIIQKVQEGISDTELGSYFTEFLQMSLWGNKCDLSISCGHDNFQENNPLGQLITYKPNILVDNTSAVFNLLQQVKTNKGTPGKVAIVLDNAGFELLTDLCLAEFLLASGLASSITFHAKTMPWYVSDVTEKDFHWLVDCMSTLNNAVLSQFSETWKKRLLDGSWHLTSSPFWTMPNDFSQMEDRNPQLYAQLGTHDLVFFKGDLNYRKLVGDLEWNPTTTFHHSLRGFNPSSVCSLRTLKADVVVGLAEGQAEERAQQDADWMIKGEWAVIAFDC